MATPLKGILKRVAGKFFRSPRIKRLELKSGPRKGRWNTPSLRAERFSGKVPTKADQDRIWSDFTKAGGGRDQFLTKARNEASITDLQAMGLSSAEAATFKRTGVLPPGYDVHHIVPRKAGGGNEMSNLVIIKNDPDHKLITAQQNAVLRGYKEGDSFDVSLPTIPPGTVTWPKSGQAAYLP